MDRLSGTPGRAGTHCGQLYSVEAAVSVSSAVSINQRCNPVSCGCLHCPGVCSHYRQERGCGGNRIVYVSMSKPGERKGDASDGSGSLLALKEPEPPACPAFLQLHHGRGSAFSEKAGRQENKPNSTLRCPRCLSEADPSNRDKTHLIPPSSPPSAESSLRSFSRFI